MPLSVQKRLDAKSHFIPFCGCQIWVGTTDRYGYGIVLVNGKRKLAHRVAYTIAKGAPKNFVCHTCDIPSCVNPDHLYDGTNSDNMRDRAERGRAKMARGEQHGRSTLTVELVAQIREMAARGITYREIAKSLGIKSSGHVSNVVNRKVWSA